MVRECIRYRFTIRKEGRERDSHMYAWYQTPDEAARAARLYNNSDLGTTIETIEVLGRNGQPITRASMETWPRLEWEEA